MNTIAPPRPNDGRDGAPHATPPAPEPEGFDLLRVPGVRRLVAAAAFPRALQGVTLATFLALAAWSWGVFAPAGVGAKLFAKTHATTLIVWGVWWPMMIWVAVLFGRVWCAVCPMELVSHLNERAATRLGLVRRTLPRWIAGGAMIVVLYATIQMLVAGVHLHRVPAYTAWFLLGQLATAAGTAWIFRDRAFCRGFCPVGLLIGTYGRGGMIAVRPAGANAPMPPNARACPNLLNPARLASNERCLVCSHCVKAGAPGSMRVVLRRPFAASDHREGIASWPVTLFVMLVSGFVTWELTSEWPAAEEIFLRAPSWLVAHFGIPATLGWLEGVWALGVVPLLLWSALGAITSRTGAAPSLGEAWRRLALPFAVVVSAGHMSKAIAKLGAWAAFLSHALSEPGGLRAAGAPFTPPAPWLPLPTAGAIGLVVLAFAIVYGVREWRLAQPSATHRAGAVPVVLLGLLFAAIIIGWLA